MEDIGSIHKVACEMQLYQEQCEKKRKRKMMMMKKKKKKKKLMVNLHQVMNEL